MSDISPRRRLTGRAAVASAFLAVPLTASFCFAEATAAPAPPSAPEAPPEWVMPVSAAPLAPPPPEAPPAPDVDQDLDAVIDIDRDVRVEQQVIVDKDGERRVVRRYRREMTAEERAEIEADLAEMHADLAESAMSRANMQREISISIAEAHADAAEARAEAMEAVTEARAEAALAHEYAPKVVLRCKDKTNIVATEVDAKGRTTMFVCEANANRIALSAVKSARKAVAADRNLTASERAEALRAIDEEISDLKRQ